MKKNGLLNRDLSAVVTAMGHYDRLVICDAGFPIPLDMDYVDLSLQPGTPSVLEVVDLLLQELEVEEAYVASEALKPMPDRLAALTDRLPQAKVEDVPHSEFKGICILD